MLAAYLISAVKSSEYVWSLPLKSTKEPSGFRNSTYNEEMRFIPANATCNISSEMC